VPPGRQRRPDASQTPVPPPGLRCHQPVPSAASRAFSSSASRAFSSSA